MERCREKERERDGDREREREKERNREMERERKISLIDGFSTSSLLFYTAGFTYGFLTWH